MQGKISIATIHRLFFITTALIEGVSLMVKYKYI